MAIALAVGAVAVAACGGDPSDEERRAALVEQLAEELVVESDGALDEDGAHCVAGRLADDIGVERFEEVVRAAAADDDPDLRAQVVDAFAACDALAPLLEPG